MTDAQPTGLVVGDLNVDGDADVAVVHANGFGSNNVVVFLGDGLGGLARGQSVPIPSSAPGLATGDFNGDGVQDLLASGSRLTNVLLGYGNGTFLRVDTRSGRMGAGYAVADFNEDGRSDFYASGNQALVLGEGSGHFAAPDFPIVSPGWAFVLAVRKGDLNEDGRDDLAVLESDQSTGKFVLDLLLSAPGGALARTTIPLTTAYSSTGAETLSVGDFDGDGHLDLVIQAQVNFVFRLLTFRGDGHGGLSAWASTDLPSASQTLAVGALDADTKSDVVLSFAPPARTEIWHATGVGTFGTPQTLAAGSIPITLEGLAVGRLNGDPRPDIVYADWGVSGGDGSIRVLLANGSGGYDLAQTIPASAGTVRLADLDQDGDLDIVYADDTNEAAPPAMYQSYLGDGAGHFGGPIESPYLGRLSAVNDFTNDGFPDVVTLGTTNRVLPGTGTGSFLSPADSYDGNFGAGYEPLWITGDFNADGNQDAVVGNAYGDLMIFHGDGHGGFVDLTPP